MVEVHYQERTADWFCRFYRTIYGTTSSFSSRRKWNVNLQKATILVDGKPTKVRISAKELRTLRKAG